MDDNLGSFKSLEQVHLKATQNIEVDGRTFEPGETIAFFDRIQVSNLHELRDYVAARGGYGNRGLVFWETTRELRMTFSQGVFSKTQFGILNNAKVLNVEEDEPILVTNVEELEVSEYGQFTLKEVPFDQFFIYLKETGEKIQVRSQVGKLIEVSTDYAYQNVVVNYRYNYMAGGTVMKVGQRCLRGFLELEGRTRVKDDTSGLITTGIITIPQLKLMSGLSIKIGAQANPVVGTFEGVGVPVGSRSESYVATFSFLNNDIDSDM